MSETWTSPDGRIAALKTPLTAGSLCSGIGGLDLGFERAGFKIKWQSEIDPWCRSKLKILYPGVHIHEDIKILPSPDLSDWTVDCIIGGIPCQPHSCAGKRQGANDERNLWPEYKRIIGLLRPRFAVLENVAGFVSSDGGRFFGGVLADLAELGYDAEWSCLRASDFGFPHRRKRVFVVAYGADVGRKSEPDIQPAGVFGETQGAAGIKSESSDRRATLANPSRHGEFRCEREDGRCRGRGVCAGGEQLAQPAGRGLGIGGDSSGGGGLAHGGQPPLDNAASPRHAPPGPGDAEGWRYVLARWPWLAPALEPGVCGLADGQSIPVDTERRHWLKALGNSVVPDCAEFVARRILEAFLEAFNER